MNRNLFRTFAFFVLITLSSRAFAVDTFYVDYAQSQISIAPVINLTDLDITFPLIPQAEYGYGSGWYGTGFDTYASGTLLATVDTAGGTIDLPGGSNVYALDSGDWLPYYGGWYPYDSYPANFGAVLDASTSGIDGLQGTAVAAIREFAIDVTSAGAIPLVGGGGSYTFSNDTSFTNTSGGLDYYGLDGILTVVGNGRTVSTPTTVANNASAASVSTLPNGLVTITIPVQSSFTLDLGVIDPVGETNALIPITGQITAYRLHTGTQGNITDLGTLGGSYNESRAYGINEKTQVVGYSYDENNQQRTFLWENGTMHNLGAGTLNGYGTSWAHGVNEDGTAAGDNYAGGEHAVTFSNGSIQNLESLTGPFGPANARDINDSGQAVGFSRNAQNVQRAVLYENGNVTDLGPGEALGINNLGQIVGNNVTNGVQRAVLYENGDVIGLGSLEGPFGAGNAFDINEAGQIVGWSSNAQGQTRPTLWVNGQAFDLGTPYGYGEAHAINDQGWAVGASGGFAMLWHDGLAIDLNSLLPNDSGWTLIEAWDINNKNQVVGWGYRTGPNGIYLGAHAFLLQVPEPSSIALLVLGGAGAFAIARRRRIVG